MSKKTTQRIKRTVFIALNFVPGGWVAMGLIVVGRKVYTKKGNEDIRTS